MGYLAMVITTAYLTYLLPSEHGRCSHVRPSPNSEQSGGEGLGGNLRHRLREDLGVPAAGAVESAARRLNVSTGEMCCSGKPSVKALLELFNTSQLTWLEGWSSSQGRVLRSPGHFE